MLQRITDQPLALDAMLVQTESPECGALVVFAGTTRRHNEGHEVVSVEYTAYKPLAEKWLADIEREALARFDIECCAIRHRIGELAIGDTSVIVVVRAVHRPDAFRAGRYAIDTVKHTVPIWKREVYADGSFVYLKGCSIHDDVTHDGDGHDQESHDNPAHTATT